MTGQQPQRDTSQYLMNHYNWIRPISSMMDWRLLKLKKNSKLCPGSIEHYKSPSSGISI